MNQANELLRTRQHFDVLDGLRGVAAITVVVFHFMEIVIPDYNKLLIAHSYLAVDFFFCLSGFVVGYAYDNRLRELGVLNFFKLRLIRLHPLVLIMSVVGLIVFVTDPFSNLWQTYSGQLAQLFGSSALMIPYPVVKERYLNLFHLNPPTWSLLWEYIINIFYAFVLVHVGRRLLWIMVVLSAIWLYYEANRLGYLSIGWGADSPWSGAPRVCFAFMAGLLVYRLRWVIRTRLGFPVLTLLLLSMFFFPYYRNNIVDPTIVVFCFPVIIALGAGVSVSGITAKICRFLGEISYPLYMVHYPFVWVFMSYLQRYKPGMQEMLIITGVSTVLLTGLSYAVLKWLDEPIRRMFRGRVKLALNKSEAGSGKAEAKEG